MNESIQGNGTKTLEFTFSLGITYFSMLIMALIPIVFGSFLSVFKGDSKGDTVLDFTFVFLF